VGQNQVEILFSILQRQHPAHGRFESLTTLARDVLGLRERRELKHVRVRRRAATRVLESGPRTIRFLTPACAAWSFTPGRSS
jgi:hypothetical protein